MNKVNCQLLLYTFFLTLSFLPTNLLTAANHNKEFNIQQLLKQKLEVFQDSCNDIGASNKQFAEETLHMGELVWLFYQQRSFRPAWLLGRYLPKKSQDFVACIQQSEDNGLLPADYHWQTITALMEKNSTTQEEELTIQTLLDTEILLTDAYLSLATHYLAGKVNPEQLKTEWHIPGRDFPMTYYLEEALKDNSLCHSLARLLPLHKSYQELKAQLKIYKKLKWKPLSITPRWNTVLQKGDVLPVISEIKQRLIMTGDLEATIELNDIFDAPLQKAVMKFQQRHGLHYDGLIRSHTINLMNISAEQKVKQLYANLERWRWMPDDLGTTYITINIPRFEMEMIKESAVVYREKVIVGRKKFPTPSFSEHMEYLVINPFWHIPKSIARDELIPSIIEDENYIVNNDIIITKGGQEINPDSLNWATINVEDYRFKQNTNAFNPMGQVKFIFPNHYDIYMHDTNNRGLFTNSHRSYSHGCIRLHEPLKFAEFLLTNYTEDWDTTRLAATYKVQAETIIHLDQKLPIHILYWTAFIDEATGELNFREDLYDWDNELYEALTRKIAL